MAGMSVGGFSGVMQAPPGMVWDPNLRGFVAKPQAPGGMNTGTTTGFKMGSDGQVEQTTTQNPRGSAENADATRPQYEVSPTGHAQSYNYQTGRWEDIGMADGYGGGGGGGSSSSRNPGGSTQPQGPNLSALIDELRSTPTSYQPAQIPITTSGANGGSPYDLAGENAAYGDSKNRIGLQTQAAIRGLRNSLGGTGKLGTGAEAAGISALYRGGLSDLSDASNQLAEQRAARAFTANQSDTDRTISQQEYNATNQQQASADEFNRRLERIRLTASLMGQMY